VSVTTYWLGRAALALLLSALAHAAYALAIARSSPGRTALRRYAETLERKLKLLRIRAHGRGVVALQFAAGALALAAAVGSGVWLWALTLPLVAFAPVKLLEQKLARRFTLVEAQLDTWLGAVANALKACPSLAEAIASTIPVVPAPISEEVELVIREYELGTPLDEALERFATRVPSRTVAGAVLALCVARRSGGNSSEMLEAAGAALRELSRLEGVVRTKTAEGKAQAFVVSAIPIPMVLAISWLDPHFFDPLTRTFLGQLVMGGAASLWLAAVLLARKILAVDV
jgi:tight adherence protein B